MFKIAMLVYASAGMRNQQHALRSRTVGAMLWSSKNSLKFKTPSQIKGGPVPQWFTAVHLCRHTLRLGRHTCFHESSLSAPTIWLVRAHSIDIGQLVLRHVFVPTRAMKHVLAGRHCSALSRNAPHKPCTYHAVVRSDPTLRRRRVPPFARMKPFLCPNTISTVRPGDVSLCRNTCITGSYCWQILRIHSVLWPHTISLVLLHNIVGKI